MYNPQQKFKGLSDDDDNELVSKTANLVERFKEQKKDMELYQFDEQACGINS